MLFSIAELAIIDKCLFELLNGYVNRTKHTNTGYTYWLAGC